jgi:hypothetical protein
MSYTAGNPAPTNLQAAHPNRRIGRQNPAPTTKAMMTTLSAHHEHDDCDMTFLAYSLLR